MPILVSFWKSKCFLIFFGLWSRNAAVMCAFNCCRHWTYCLKILGTKRRCVSCSILFVVQRYFKLASCSFQIFSSVIIMSTRSLRIVSTFRTRKLWLIIFHFWKRFRSSWTRTLFIFSSTRYKKIFYFPYIYLYMYMYKGDDNFSKRTIFRCTLKRLNFSTTAKAWFGLLWELFLSTSTGVVDLF